MRQIKLSVRTDKTITYGTNSDFNEPTTADHKVDNFYLPVSGIGSAGQGDLMPN